MNGRANLRCLGCGAIEFPNETALRALRGKVGIRCPRCGARNRVWQDKGGQLRIILVSGPTVEPNDDHDGTPAGIMISNFVFDLQRSIDAVFVRYADNTEALADLTRRLRRIRVGNYGGTERAEMARHAPGLQDYVEDLSDAVRRCSGVMIRCRSDKLWEVGRIGMSPSMAIGRGESLFEATKEFLRAENESTPRKETPSPSAG